MAAFNKFNIFTINLVDGKHNFASDTFKVMLTNTAPTSANQVFGDLTEISAGNGYLAGGTASTVTVATSTGTCTVSGTQVVFTASGGTIGPLRYAVLYNVTQSSPVKPLVGWWDYGSSITLADTETLTVEFNSTTPGTVFTVT